MLLAPAFWLLACLPEYPIESIQFSPDGRYLAYYAPNLGIKVVDLEASRDFILLSGDIKGNVFDWSPDSQRIVYCSASSGSWDVWSIDLERRTTQLTSDPSKDFAPQWARDGSGVYFVSYRNGDADLWLHDIKIAADRCVVARPEDQLSPRLSLDGQWMSYLSYEQGKPQLFVLDLKTSETRLVHSPAGIDAAIDAPSAFWSADSRNLLFTARENNIYSLHIYDTLRRERREIHRSTYPISSPLISPDGNQMFYVEQGRIVRRSLDALFPRRLYFDGFTQNIAAMHPQGRYLCFSVEKSFLGMCRPDFSEKRFLSFRIEDELFLGHIYGLRKKRAKAIKIYDDLLKSVQMDEHLAAVKFHYALELYKLGETRRATRLLEELAESPAAEPGADAIKMLGYAYLFGGNPEKARATFERYLSRLPSDNRTIPPALEVLRSQNEELIRRFGKASKLTFLGDYGAATKEFRRLLRRYPDDPAVHAEYLSAISEIDTTMSPVVLFDPRLERQYKKESAKMLEYFTETALSSPRLDELRNDLFWRYVDLGDYTDARALLLEALKSGNQEVLTPSLTELLAYYVEPEAATDELTPAVHEVALHPTVAKRLLKAAPGEHVKFLLHLGLAKRSCLEQDAARAKLEIARARSALDAAKPKLLPQQINKYELTLCLLEAKSLELQTLFHDAMAAYEKAESLLEPLAADVPKMVWELKFQRAFLNFNLHRHDLLKRIAQLRISLGDGLTIPYRDRAHVVLALKGFWEIAQQTADPEAALQAKYFSAVCYARLQETSMAQSLFREFLRTSDLPLFLKKKVEVELAASYDEIEVNVLAKQCYADLLRMDLDKNELLLLQAQR